MDIRTERLAKSFGVKSVLKDVSVSVRGGESLVVIGGSGSGKTVLLRTLIGLERPDSGVALADGVPVPMPYTRAHQAMMRRVGVLFQAGALFDSLPVWQNVMFSALRHEKISRSEAMRRAAVRLEEVGLDDSVATAFPSELSGGMQKRVALARAVSHDPELIFFDEPTTGLDPLMSEVINGLIAGCRKRTGAATFTITHDMKSAFAVADKIAMLDGGVIRACGTPDELLATQDEAVRSFLAAAAWREGARL